MKKVISFILAIVMTVVLLFPVNVGAVDASSKAGVVSITSGYLNVRSKGSTSSSIIYLLKKQSLLTIISESGDWYYVEYAKNKYGYCSKKYISRLSSDAYYVNISAGSLNVRSGPSTSYTKQDSLSAGENVLVIDSSGEWKKILYHGTKSGYVHGKYLSASSSDSTYGAIRLNVPSYKQTDSRWANVTLGNSAKTIGKIGCVTTGIAMMQSYRTGTTIYPDAMSKKLSYSSSGNVYWPSDYVVTTDSTGYLQAIYKLLRAGKPVLFGAKNVYGGQHWVVITGFSGGNSLSASAFTINDPGSDSRTNLQQFLNQYPNIYKYFHY